VAKVKKETGVTGERNTSTKGQEKAGKRQVGKRKARGTAKTARPGATKRSGARKQSPSTGRKQVKTARKQAKKSASARGGSAKRALTVVRGRSPGVPVVRVAVKPLDPLRMCGPGTSVQFLYRVDEQVDGRHTAHLVFFDRHGWYCEHGRTCPAVGHARKYNGQIARVS
jgi:hypothetical protein